MKRVVLIVIAVSGLSCGHHATAQVVQLPTFNFFGISTTVSVPDSGAGFVGGNSTSSMGRFERGLPMFGHAPIAGRTFGGRAIAGRTQASGVSVSATIHDFETMDEALLGNGSAIVRQPLPLSSPPLAGHGLGRREGARVAATPTLADSAGRRSVAELRRQQASISAAALDEGRGDYDRARVLLAEGKIGTARVYMQRALKRADPALRVEIDSELRRLHLAGRVAGADSRAAIER
jgi:hypothetical protein